MNNFEKKNYLNEGSLNIKYLDIAGILCCRFCNKKNKYRYNLLEKTYEDMKKYIDYLDIIKLLQEFTKLKIILLSKSQLKLFSHISKPKISLVNNDIRNDYLSGKIFENPNLSINELFEAYSKLSKRNDSIIDIRLLSLLDQGLKECFNNIISLDENSEV